MAYTAPPTPNVAQESTLQQILTATGGPGGIASWIDRGATTINSLVVKASAGTLIEFQATNENAAGGANRWVMLFDAAALPANGATPKLMPWILPPQGFLSVSALGFVAVNGITLAISTTNTTLTVSVDAPGTASISARFI